jgi:hypothetical protein
LELAHEDANGPYREADKRFGTNSAHTDAAAAAVQVSTITEDPADAYDDTCQSAYTYVPCGQAASAVPDGQYDTALWNGELLHQAVLLRDIFGNPLSCKPVNEAWLTSSVTALAAAIYDEWAFDRLPILADALEEAGCDVQEILAHCRQPAEHARGCWVVDLLLKKK